MSKGFLESLKLIMKIYIPNNILIVTQEIILAYPFSLENNTATTPTIALSKAMRSVRITTGLYIYSYLFLTVQKSIAGVNISSANIAPTINVGSSIKLLMIFLKRRYKMNATVDNPNVISCIVEV